MSDLTGILTAVAADGTYACGLFVKNEKGDYISIGIGIFSPNHELHKICSSEKEAISYIKLIDTASIDKTSKPLSIAKVKKCKRDLRITFYTKTVDCTVQPAMLAMSLALGVIPSFSRPAVSNDNPLAESFFKTLKYSSAYPRHPFKYYH